MPKSSEARAAGEGIPIQIIRRGSEVREVFLNKLAETFSRDVVARKALAWDWIFNRDLGPDAPPVEVLTAFHKGNLVGGSIINVSRFRYRGEDCFVRSAFSSNIDPRLRGLGISLLRESLNYPHLSVGIAIDERLGRVYERYGAVGRPRFQMFSVLRPGSAVARRDRRAAVLAAPGDALWQLVQGGVSLARPRLARDETISLATEFGAEHDAFWQRAVENHRLLQVRDSAYMTWRFLQMPVQNYDVLQLRRRGVLQGYVAVGHAINAERGTGQVTDILTIDDDERSLALLFLAAQKRLRQLGAEVAAFGSVENAALQNAARRAGFNRSKPTRPAQAAFKTNPSLQAELKKDLADFYLTRADQDEDF